MALELANLVYQTTTTEGTSNLTVASITGFQTFSNGRGTGSSNTFPYFIRHQTATEWEVGIGYMSDASTLVRSSVLDSSNAGSLVDFSAGTKNATIDVPTSKQIFLDGDSKINLGADSFIDGSSGDINYDTLTINRDHIFKAGGSEILRLYGDDGWSLFKVNGGAEADYFDIATTVWNGGTVAANSQVSTTITMTGATTAGTGMMVNNNAPIAGLVYSAICTATNSVDLYISNITNSAIGAGNRTYTVVGFGN